MLIREAFLASFDLVGHCNKYREDCGKCLFYSAGKCAIKYPYTWHGQDIIDRYLNHQKAKGEIK